MRALLAVFVLLALLSASFATGVVADRTGVLPGSVVGEPPGMSGTFSVFWQAWNLVQQHYVDRQAVDATRMTYGAIEGMLDSLDDTGHTRFLSPSDVRDEAEALSGRLEGIGAEVALRNGQPTIVAPIAGSPAQQAGLRPGDTIVRVDGQDTASLSLSQVVNLVRGPAGTTVTLTILHPGETSLIDIPLVRAEVSVPSVTWARLPGTTVAQILVSQFAEHASDELAGALADARAGQATAVILDLRNDPGGLRDEAIGVASQFLRDGDVLLEQDARGRRKAYPVQPGGVATDIPLVVLINEGTASSAEIVAGALQDHLRARLVGTTTVGTGTVLSQYPLDDGSAIFLGTAEWFTPNGRQIWHQGIAPDVTVPLPPGQVPLTPLKRAGSRPSSFRTVATRNCCGPFKRRAMGRPAIAKGRPAIRSSSSPMARERGGSALPTGEAEPGPVARGRFRARRPSALSRA